MSTKTLSDPVALARRYFDAWRQRDAAAVLATLAPGGTYEDPLTGGPIAGAAFAGYMQGLWAAFPDLDFTLGEVVRVADGRVHGLWRMHGHNHGSFNGLPPTGRAVDLPGMDVIEVGAEGVTSVSGYFDSAVVPRQLGLDVIVQPPELGPFSFGISTVVRRPHPVVPAVLAFTELMAADLTQVQPIRDLSRQTVMEQLDNPAFLGLTAAVAGRRMTTVSAWASHEALSAAMRSGTHAQAMQQFFRDGIAEGGHTAVYAPVRQGPHWRRCGACGAMTKLDAAQGHCTHCGADVTALA
ncbi:MAG: nuclear transport factor 2 family protein [Burkholderiaceae bacterium]|nr:nuclear transport factor 2 family protein [Burkholderiaceae bacterium]